MEVCEYQASIASQSWSIRWRYQSDSKLIAQLGLKSTFHKYYFRDRASRRCLVLHKERCCFRSNWPVHFWLQLHAFTGPPPRPGIPVRIIWWTLSQSGQEIERRQKSKSPKIQWSGKKADNILPVCTVIILRILCIAALTTSHILHYMVLLQPSGRES